MAYTTAIFDRTLVDIQNKTSKSYFNFGDWTRIYDNCLIVKNLADTEYSTTLNFDVVSVPDGETILTIIDINKLLGNIETIRLYIATNDPGLITDPLFVEVKDDWTDGQLGLALYFPTINSWEKVIDLMHEALT